MPEIQPVQHQPNSARCRFTMSTEDTYSNHEFCAFELPGCEGCPNAMHLIKTVGSTEDPMKSMTLRGWIAGASIPEKSLCAQSGMAAMDQYIHQENLILFKKRLAEAHSDAEREVLLKLLADEEAKVAPPRNGVLWPR